MGLGEWLVILVLAVSMTSIIIWTTNQSGGSYVGELDMTCNCCKIDRKALSERMNKAAGLEDNRRLVLVVEALENNDLDKLDTMIRRWQRWVNTMEHVRKILDNPNEC